MRSDLHPPQSNSVQSEAIHFSFARLLFRLFTISSSGRKFPADSGLVWPDIRIFKDLVRVSFSLNFTWGSIALKQFMGSYLGYFDKSV
jgi:hypothetical protein